jgi:hypothetical protein
VSTHRKFLFAAVGCLLWTAPAFAGPNDLPRGALPGEAADGTLGMALMAASVNANATLAHGSGVASTTKLGGNGLYQVTFDRDVSLCTYVATIGPANTSSAEGQIDVALRAGNSSAVFVNTHNAAGSSTDQPFHLLVFCNK